MARPWYRYGPSMAPPRTVHGRSTDPLWRVRGVIVDNSWRVHGESLGSQRRVHGEPMARPCHVWRLHSASMEGTMQRPWRIHGASIDPPWNSRPGGSIYTPCGSPWIFHGPSTVPGSNNKRIEYPAGATPTWSPHQPGDAIGDGFPTYRKTRFIGRFQFIIYSI